MGLGLDAERKAAGATTFVESTWARIDQVRAEVGALKSRSSVEVAAQEFTAILSRRFATVVLARVFMVLPFSALAARDREFARRLVPDETQLKPTTQVLSLLGTSGVEANWNDRRRSEGHLAIPLVDRSFVQGIPMLARLLSELGVDLAKLDSGEQIATRKMMGGNNGTFYVSDAQTAVDAERRSIIPASDFVKRHGVRTVFGMGGAYVDASLAVAIVFSSETIPRAVVDRFPSLISNFKMATGEQQQQNRIFEAS